MASKSTTVSVPWSTDEFEYLGQLVGDEVEFLVRVRCHPAEPRTWDHPGCPPEFELLDVSKITDPPDGNTDAWQQALLQWARKQFDEETPAWQQLLERASELADEQDQPHED